MEEFLNKEGVRQVLEGAKGYVDTQVNTKQDTLIPGTNIKNVNGESILSTGNIEIPDIMSIQEVRDTAIDVLYPALPAPTDVEATDETISFDAVSGAEKYEVYANGSWIGEQLVTRTLRVSIDLTTLSGWSALPDGTYDITVGATAEGYPRIKQSSAVSVVKESTYNIITSVTNGYYNGPSEIKSSATATITITADSGYILPNSITVINAQYTYDSPNGIVILSKPVGDVSVNIVCEQPFLTFSSISPFNIYAEQGWDGILEYSTDKENWTEWDGAGIESGSDNEIYFRGIGNTVITGSGMMGWQLSGENISCSGNIETLLDYQTVSNGQHPAMGESCYSDMFSGCYSLTQAPKLSATTLPDYCYNSMFSNCESLTTAPELPATTLADSCYYEMFYGCDSLTTAPELPATTLANWCYNGMFSGCTNLETAPQLPATTLTVGCYYRMFSNCTSLIVAPELPATTLETSCYNGMFSGCTSLVTAPELPVTKLASSCYTGMFSNCTSLIAAPQLPATTLTVACYNSMFSYCASLTTVPALPATTLAISCYINMFYGCTSLYASDTQTAEAQYEWRIPANDVVSGTTRAQSNMFTNCLGTRSSNNLAGQTGQQYIYYTQNPPVGSN